jgi:hypothetical protein
MSVSVVTTVKIIVILQFLSIPSTVHSLTQCTARMPFNPVQGEKFILCVYAVVHNIGPQQCVSECISRKPRCKAVNYSRNQLTCEICSSTLNYVPSEEYMKINLEKVICFLSRTTFLKLKRLRKKRLHAN